MDIKTLHEKITTSNKKRNDRLKARYKLARELGFSSSESAILSHCPADEIKRLAKEAEAKR